VKLLLTQLQQKLQCKCFQNIVIGSEHLFNTLHQSYYHTIYIIQISSTASNIIIQLWRIHARTFIDYMSVKKIPFLVTCFMVFMQTSMSSCNALQRLHTQELIITKNKSSSHQKFFLHFSKWTYQSHKSHHPSSHAHENTFHFIHWKVMHSSKTNH